MTPESYSFLSVFGPAGKGQGTSFICPGPSEFVVTVLASVTEDSHILQACALRNMASVSWAQVAQSSKAAQIKN